jgi:amidase
MPDPDRMLAGWVPFCAMECAIAHRETWPSRRDEYGPELNLLLDMAQQQVTGATIAETKIERDKYAGRLAATFRDVDLIAMPTLLGPLPLHADLEGLFAENPIMMARHMSPFDMTGSPTITLHGGFDGNGMPIGFQLVGRHLSEDLLLRAGHAYQQVTDWHTRHPPV